MGIKMGRRNLTLKALSAKFQMTLEPCKGTDGNARITAVPWNFNLIKNMDIVVFLGLKGLNFDSINASYFRRDVTT